MTPQELALALMTAVFVDHDADAARALLAPDYIQHNPDIPTGAEGILSVIPLLKQHGVTLTTHRVLSEGDLVVLHNTYENADVFGAPTLAAFDVFRVEEGKLAEHWDNLQPVPEVTASGRGMTDGPTEVVDLDKTAANKAVVEGFLTDVFLGGQFEKATQYISPGPEGYLQHNPSIPDGLEALGATIAEFAATGREVKFLDTHMVVAEGNFVFSASEATMGGAPVAFFDLWRLEDGMMVEHWDTVAPIPAEMAHDNGKF